MIWKMVENCSFKRNLFRVIVIAFFAFTFISANKIGMELKVTKRIPLNGVPSASGIEIFNDSIYIVGDNSPWLFKLDADYKVIDKFQIYPLDNLENDTIKKSNKPDFEAMTIVQNNATTEFYIFGSGSKSPQRDVLIKIDINHPENWKPFSLVNFYADLKSLCGFTDDDLNIEAAAVINDFLYLFNRGKNTMIQFSISDFNSFILDERDEIKFNIINVNLPKINEIESGFSGACYLPEMNKILFTSSVENTPNWIDDGQVLGSFVGIIDLANLETTVQPICVPVSENGKQLPLKIESIAVQSVQKKKIRILMATDSDGGTSELVEATLFVD